MEDHFHLEFDCNSYIIFETLNFKDSQPAELLTMRMINESYLISSNHMKIWVAFKGKKKN